jgi:8-oxo-dGTP diphosphatase
MSNSLASENPALPPQKVYPMPFVRIELAVLSVIDGALQVLLGRRTGPPHEGRWALPGGVLRIDLDADLDAACQRVAHERLGSALPNPVQLEARGGRSRDPRAPWALSVVYRSVALAEGLQVAPGKRISGLKWVEADEAAADAKLALDHASLVAHAVEALRADVAALHFPAGLLAEPFTLGELQAASEAVLARPLDKSSFRRRLDTAGCVEPVEGEMRTGAFRPAQMYRLQRMATS